MNIGLKKRVSKKVKSSNYRRKSARILKQIGRGPLRLHIYDYRNYSFELVVNDNTSTQQLKHIIADKMGLRLSNFDNMELYISGITKLMNGSIARQGVRNEEKIKMIVIIPAS